MKNISNHRKGASFENKFAQFLRDEHGYKCRVKAFMEQKHNTRNVEVDIVGHKTEKSFQTIDFFMRYFAICCVVFLAIPFILHYGFDYAWTSDFDLIMYIALACEFIALILFVLIHFKIVGQEYVWVECKDQQKPATHKQAQKAVNEYNNYNGKYKFKKIIFVSNNGFVDNALKYLEDNNVECYFSDNNKFKSTTYFE